jgi:DNA-binding SARP family transcriptional activator/tetratricopeptide (TPR) repeat protein
MLGVRVVGGLELTLDGEPLQAPSGRPARSLLGWLATHPGSHSRGVVAAALWPDVTDESARASLRTALSAVRDSLGAAAQSALPADRQTVGLAQPPAVSVDVREFDALLTAGRPAEALAVIGDGELLPELDSDWVLRERDHHRDRVGAAMTQLSREAQSAGDRATAVAWLKRRAELDPFDEGAHRELIEALDRVGDRAGALAVYNRFADRLRRELAVAPSAATRGLAASLRAADPAATPDRYQERGQPPPLPRRLQPARWARPFVGRADALARLSSAWASAQAGGPAFAIIVGEPGIGKSRLAAQFAAEVLASGAVVLAGAAQEEQSWAYQPIADALRPVAGEELPAVTAIVDDAVAQAQLHERLASLLEHASGGRALLLVLDDVQWADPDTLAFLRSVAGRGLAVPLLTLATARAGEYGGDSDLARTVGAIMREAAVTQVTIDGLDLSETAALVAARAGGPTLAHSDLEALIRRTSGNPFFLEALVDAGLTASGAAVPRGLAELLVSRVQALGPIVARALEAAAIAGREFDPALVAGIAGIGLDESVAALDDAVEAQLVAPVADRPGRMGFVHDLVHEALTVKLAPGRSATLHARAVDVLEPRAEDGADDALAAAAAHAIAALPATGVQRAGELAERAGLRLIASRAPADAAQLLVGALTACEDAGAPIALRARLRLALGDALRSAGSNEADATFESALFDARRTGERGLIARAALGAVGPVVTIGAVDRGRVAILEEALDALDGDESTLTAQVQARLSVELAYDADTDRRDRLSAAALSHARARGDARTLAAALGARHVALWGPDHTHERLPLADEMLALARRADDPALELQARTWRIVDLEELGDGAALEAELDAYAETAARVPQSPYAWYVPAWQSTRAFLGGRPARGRELQRQAVRLGRRAGDRNVQFLQRAEFIVALADDRAYDIDLLWQTDRVRKSPVGWAYRALSTWALVADGQVAEARLEMQAQRRAGVPRSWPRDTNWLSAAKELSEAACLLGDLEVGAALEELLEPFAERMVVSARALMCMGSVYGALARLAALRGDLDCAVERFEHAIDQDERSGALIWAMHHRFRLGETLLARGQADEAAGLLETVVSRAPGMGLARLAERARCATISA